MYTSTPESKREAAVQLLFTNTTARDDNKHGAYGHWKVTGRFNGRNTMQAATTTPLGLALWTPSTAVIAFSGVDMANGSRGGKHEERKGGHGLVHLHLLSFVNTARRIGLGLLVSA